MPGSAAAPPVARARIFSRNSQCLHSERRVEIVLFPGLKNRDRGTRFLVLIQQIGIC